MFFPEDLGTLAHEHYNKATRQDIPTPHVHDPSVPGEIRIPEPWEMP